MEKCILEGPQTIQNRPQDGCVVVDNGEIQAKFIEVHEAHHEIRLFGNKGQNEFASHIELNYIQAERQFAEHIVYIQTGGIDDAMEHAKLLQKALNCLNTLLRLTAKS
jgi:hypothetical protein